MYESWRECGQEKNMSKSGIDKGCPRSTFIALCEFGLIIGIPENNYSKRGLKENKVYAKKAIELLIDDPKLIKLKPIELWNKITDKDYNSQMDVVMALWKEELIKIKEV